MGIHANQQDRQGLVNKIGINFYSTGRVEEMFIINIDSKVMVKVFVVRDKFIGKGEIMQEATLL